MRAFLRLISFLSPVLLALPAAAQTYPNRVVKLVVPFGAGGPADVFARILAQHLSEETKQSFIIENRPGAGSVDAPRLCRQVEAGWLPAADHVEPPDHQRAPDPKKAVSADA